MSSKNLEYEILNNYIAKQKNNIKELDNRKVILQNKIKEEYKKLTNVKKDLESQKFKNNLLIDKYKSLKRIIKTKGLIISIENVKEDISPWENLFIKKYQEHYILVKKDGRFIGYIDEELVQAFKSEIEREKYSIIVTRVNSFKVKAQFMIK